MIRALVFVLALMLPATGAWADRYSDCQQSADLDRLIRGCTQIIEWVEKLHSRGVGTEATQKSRASAYNNRGSGYIKKGQLDRAIADYDKAIKLDPDVAMAYYNRGETYGKKGELDRAIADYDKAIALDPNDADAYNNRGLIYARKGEGDPAIADYDKAIKLDPNIAAAYRNRALVFYFGEGEVDQAIADFRKVLEINPSDPVAKTLLTVLKAEKAAEEAAAAAKPKEQSCINPVRTAYGVRCR
jgi:tetratricopeptide (TPR) repeat protein